MGVGVFLAVLILLVDYQKIIDLAPFIYFVSLVLLLLVFFVGSERLGAQRWLSLGPLSFQPSEFIKLSYILMLGWYLGHKKDSIEGISNIIVPMLLLGPAFVLILIQPDLGTSLILFPIFFAMVYVAGVNLKYILAVFGVGILSSPFFWQFLKDYQKNRLLVFLNPNLDPLGAGYTIIQSKIAIGSGYLIGKGWLSGTQNQLNFLPERHTDFIFSVVGEEWGFIGSLVVVLLFFVIIYRGLKIINETPDFYGRLIASGIVALLSFQIVVNIGMTLGLLPVVGLTLPFISYGGTSIISSMIAVGILLSISMRRPLF